MNRRYFIKLLSMLGFGAFMTSCSAGTIIASDPLKNIQDDNEKVTLFRLSSRKTNCNTCKNHHYNTYYLTEKAADAGRPHAHCKCRIVKHPVGKSWVDDTFENTDNVDIREI